MVNFRTFLSGQLILQHIPNFWRVPFECQLLKKKSFEKMRKNLCSYVVLLCLWQLLNFSICSRCVKYALYYFHFFLRIAWSSRFLLSFLYTRNWSDFESFLEILSSSFVSLFFVLDIVLVQSRSGRTYNAPNLFLKNI